MVQVRCKDEARSTSRRLIPVTFIGLDRLEEGSFPSFVVVNEAFNPYVAISLKILYALGHMRGLFGLKLLLGRGHDVLL